MNLIEPQIVVAFFFGLVFVTALIILAIKFPDPTAFQYTVFRIVLALAAAGVAAMIPGIIRVEMSATVGIMVRAGGALAVFVIVFFRNPAALVRHERDTPVATHTGGMRADQSDLLSPIIDRLDDGLQDALALAALQAKRDDEPVVATRHVFAAFLRLRSGKLDDLLARLPNDALPPPLEGELSPDRRILMRPIEFSGCVRESLRHLSPKSTPDRRLGTEDVFVDIARHGTGESVKRLRTHGIDEERIQAIVRQLGWDLIERTAQPSA